jgi:polyisoprenoid-binding protein YceI
MTRTTLGLAALVLVGAVACNDTKKEADPSTAMPSASAATSAAPSASSSAAGSDVPVPAGATRFALETGKGSFLIDAPLEKIKGASDEVTGYLDANTKEIGKSTGVIKVRLSTLKTSTFGDPDKDVAQTEHARNWMEVGNDSSAETRMKYEWATFNVTSIDTPTASLAAAADANGAKTISAKVSGDVMIHGVTSKVTVPVTLTFKGTADAPTELDIKTDEPMAISMKEHDVKPRDKVGGFLNGALDRIGKKIDDKVQVSFEGVSKTTMPKQP